MIVNDIYSIQFEELKKKENVWNINTIINYPVDCTLKCIPHPGEHEKQFPFVIMLGWKICSSHVCNETHVLQEFSPNYHTQSIATERKAERCKTQYLQETVPAHRLAELTEYSRWHRLQNQPTWPNYIRVTHLKGYLWYRWEYYLLE